MALKQQSKVFFLSQGGLDKDVTVIVKEGTVEFKRNNNDSLLVVLTFEEISDLYYEVFPASTLTKPNV